MIALSQHVEKALHGLSYAWREGEREFISVPVQYPSGALCTVEISVGKQKAHINDMGLGYLEAETLCRDSSFTSVAPVIARRHGIKTDGNRFHVEDIDHAQMAAAIIAVANASAAAAHAAVARDSERKEEVRANAIFQKVRLAFPASNVIRFIEISGGKASWGVHNVVQLGGDRMAIFEPVTNHQNSVSSKFLMFSDLVQRGDLSLNAVVRDQTKLSAKAQMLKQVANIIGVNEGIDTYRMKVGVR